MRRATLFASFLFLMPLAGNVAVADSGPIATSQDTGGAVRARRDTTSATIDRSQPITGGEIKCVNGKAKGYDCHNVDLVAFLPAAALGATDSIVYRGPLPVHGGRLVQKMYGMWGWTDSATGRDFAVVGLVGATSFVEVTDPANPKYLGTLPRPPGTGLTENRDIKVYKNHALITTWAAGPHGVQVFDLTQLRDVKNPPVTFQETVRYDRIGTAHTLALNQATGYAYATYTNGEQRCGPGLHMIDVRNPAQPVFAGCYDRPTGGIHETQCVIYQGPDQRYRGRELCFNANQGAGINIADVTDKRQPKTLGAATYPSIAYAHQGALSEDHRYFFLGDELDEQRSALTKTRTLIFDVSDLEDPVLVKEFFATVGATDHTMFVRGRYLYQDNYLAGLRVLDITDPKEPKEAGYFDTFPDDGTKQADFGGAHDMFVHFKQDGLVAINDIADGMFILRYRPSFNRSAPAPAR